MRDVRDNLDLAQLQNARQGFIVNIRDDHKKLHGAGCDAVGAMVTLAYRKVFFEESAEAKRWLDDTYGPAGWTTCGRCGGTNPLLIHIDLPPGFNFPSL